MVLARRRAEVGWKGTLEEGRGSFTVGSWMVGEVPVTWSSRTSPEEAGTSPEELMAAAHASCYAMALSLALQQRGTRPENIDVEAACTLDDLAGGSGSPGWTSRSAGASPAWTATASGAPPSTRTRSAPPPTPPRTTSRSG